MQKLDSSTFDAASNERVTFSLAHSNQVSGVVASVDGAPGVHLIKEREIRANVGVTYDLDMLFARFKP